MSLELLGTCSIRILDWMHISLVLQTSITLYTSRFAFDSCIGFLEDTLLALSWRQVALNPEIRPQCSRKMVMHDYIYAFTISRGYLAQREPIDNS